MSSLQKKVILRLISGVFLHGYLPSCGFIEQGEVIYLDLQGRIAAVPVTEVKMISYVRDFNLTDQRNPERLQRRSFMSRPRTDGLWVRITFGGDADVLEGMAPADISLLDQTVRDAGIYLLPPDARTNTQRIYVPRVAVESFEVLALITSRRKSKVIVRAASDEGGSAQSASRQSALFGEEPEAPEHRGEHAKR